MKHVNFISMIPVNPNVAFIYKPQVSLESIHAAVRKAEVVS